MDDRVWSYNAIWRRICLNHLELNCTHPAANNEGIVLMNGTISFQEIWLQVHFKQVPVGHIKNTEKPCTGEVICQQ
jgi:hypothetical protein